MIEKIDEKYCARCGRLLDPWKESGLRCLACQIETLRAQLQATEKRAEEAEDRRQETITMCSHLESRLCNAKAREAVLSDALRDACLCEAQYGIQPPQKWLDALSALPARSAAVLAVLDAAKSEEENHRFIKDGRDCLCDTCKAVRKLEDQ